MYRKIFASVALLSLLCSTNALAGIRDNINLAEIPPQMQPGTVIEYLDNSTYTVLSGGELDPATLNENGLTAKAQASANKNMQKSRISGNVTKVADPSPSAGLRVIYDGDGLIRAFEGGTYRYSPLPSGSTSPNGTYTWGSQNNTLTVTDTTVTGTGRLTTFSDTIGESDNTLTKGDVATRGDKDNPKFGTTLSVTAPTADGSTETHEMNKADNGSLPDAILDIWKTGVENWGYTWNSNLSINNGSYTYDR